MENQEKHPDDQKEWRYVVHDDKLFKVIDEAHHEVGHKGQSLTKKPCKVIHLSGIKYEAKSR